MPRTVGPTVWDSLGILGRPEPGYDNFYYMYIVFTYMYVVKEVKLKIDFNAIRVYSLYIPMCS